MEFEQEPTDERLGELLRDVEVPADLKSQLHEIPTQHESDEFDQSIVKKKNINGSSNGAWWTFVLAASLIGIGLFVVSQYWPSPDGIVGPENKLVKNEEPVNKTPDVKPSNDPTEFEIELAKFQAGQEELEAALHAVEIAHLEVQLTNLNQPIAFQMNQQEVESMIAAMSEEYAIPLGKSESQVKTQMAQVIERFPGTRGARIAQDFISANN